jgi:hypothetical protein
MDDKKPDANDQGKAPESGSEKPSRYIIPNVRIGPGFTVILPEPDGVARRPRKKRGG